MFKRICTGGVVAGLLFFNVALAQNNTSTDPDLLAIIKQLQAQIQSLQAQVVDLQAQVQSVKIELKFSRALAQGATGDDVIQLQEFLKTFTGAYPDGLITGYFGPLTEAAVKRFQEQNGIESVGIVGPITQDKLNVLFTAIPSTPAIPSPGTGMPVVPAPVSVAGIGLTLSLASNNPAADTLISSAASAAAGVAVLAVNLTAGNGSAMTVSELKFHKNGALADSSISSAYLVENGKVLYKYSSISGSVIDFGGLSLSVAAGQTRTMWLVIDISGGLSVGNTVSFGLNTASDVMARDTSNNSVAASGSFPVIGNIFTATSVSNLSPTTPATPSTPPFTSSVIHVLSPNGGEQWQTGGTYTIKYSAKMPAGDKALLIYLQKGYDAPTTKTGVNSSLLIGVTTNLESYTYTVPSIIQSWPGLGSNYTIRIYGEGSYDPNNANSYVGDESDALFSIVAGQVNASVPAPTTPGIPVTTTGGGGYGTVATPTPMPTPTPTPTPTLAPTILTTQDKIAALVAQINALQNQLNTTADDATRTSLMAQIAALQTQVQALQLLPTSAPTPIPTTYTPTPTPTMQATSTAQASSIMVLSPNGGETLTVGQTYGIKWTGENNAVDVYLLDNPTRLGKKIFSGITNNNYVSWIAAQLSSSDLYNGTNGTYATPSGQYVMWVGCTDNNCTVDDSDSYFKIVE